MKIQTVIAKFRYGLFVLVSLILAVLAGQIAWARVVDTSPVTDQRWVISEIYLGDIDGNGSYMELYNNDDNTSLGWKDFVINLPFDVDLPPIFDLRVYKPHAYKTLKFDDGAYGWLAKYYVKFMYGDSVFYEIKDALDESPNYSYQRCQSTDDDGKRVLSDKFYYGKKSAGKAIDCSDKSLVETMAGETGKCEGLKLSEIGSNLYPEEQFIEVGNASDKIINLADCYLTLDKEKKDTYLPLEDYELEPGDVHELYLNELDGAPTLTRTTGIVYLLDNDHATVTDYYRYREAKRDTSMALSDRDNKWHLTYKMTPGEDNVIAEYPDCADGQYRDETTHKCRIITDDPEPDNKQDDETDDGFVPCKDGYERNPETNRCRKIVTEDDVETGLVPCKEGYYRNPETNRCKKIASSDNSDNLTPCREGYTRNPATNRCVKNTSTTANLVPCKDGYERNPETNRCVKKKMATTLTPCKEGYERNPETNRCVKKKDAKDDKPADYPVKSEASAESDSTRTLIIALIIIGVLSIGVLIWQYRHELARLFGGQGARADKANKLADDKTAVDDWISQLEKADDINSRTDSSYKTSKGMSQVRKTDESDKPDK